MYRITDRARRDEKGFSLVELLVVIVILGILAGIVVFAVGGINDRGKNSACASDVKTLQAAEEAYFAKNASYGTEAELVSGGFLRDQSDLYNVTPDNAASPKTFSIAVQDTDCPAA